MCTLTSESVFQTRCKSTFSLSRTHTWLKCANSSFISCIFVKCGGTSIGASLSGSPELIARNQVKRLIPFV